MFVVLKEVSQKVGLTSQGNAAIASLDQMYSQTFAPIIARKSQIDAEVASYDPEITIEPPIEEPKEPETPPFQSPDPVVPTDDPGSEPSDPEPSEPVQDGQPN